MPHVSPPDATNPGTPLVYQGPLPESRPVLTVENATKWYAVYRLHPDGRVEEVTDWWERGGEWCDHVPRPSSCTVYAAGAGDDWCQNSLDMITGRYAREILDNGEEPDWVPREE